MVYKGLVCKEENTHDDEFDLREDGLYYKSNQSKEYIKISSWIQFITKIRNKDNTGWSRRVEIKRPDGTKTQLNLKYEDMYGKVDTIFAQLSSNGFEINPQPKYKTLLLAYLVSQDCDNKFGLLVDKIGWLNDEVYVLPDESFGNCTDEKIYFDETIENLFNQQGTLDEWRDNVAKLCIGNKILVLSLCYAFTGPLLRLCDVEGLGLHIYGCSSSGKSSSAIVAGSVCGGIRSRGFLRQWRSTHNALEHTATMHNDNLLILDEISQATADTVNHVAYMLANGQGRERLKADTTKRKTKTWQLSSTLARQISSGENP